MTAHLSGSAAAIAWKPARDAVVEGFVHPFVAIFIAGAGGGAGAAGFRAHIQD